MGIEDRNNAERVTKILSGQAISARWLNKLVDGTNEALAGLDPPRSLRQRSTQEQVNTLEEPTATPNLIVLETALCETHEVTIASDNDPSITFTIARVDKIVFSYLDRLFELRIDCW